MKRTAAERNNVADVYKRQAFVFLVPLENEQPAKQAVEHVSAGS